MVHFKSLVLKAFGGKTTLSWNIYFVVLMAGLLGTCPLLIFKVFGCWDEDFL